MMPMKHPTLLPHITMSNGLSAFLPSFLSPFLPAFLPAFLPSFLPAFLFFISYSSCKSFSLKKIET